MSVNLESIVNLQILQIFYKLENSIFFVLSESDEDEDDDDE